MIVVPADESAEIVENPFYLVMFSPFRPRTVRSRCLGENTSRSLTLKTSMVDFAWKPLTVEAAYAKNKETETIPPNSQLLDAHDFT